MTVNIETCVTKILEVGDEMRLGVTIEEQVVTGVRYKKGGGIWNTASGVDVFNFAREYPEQFQELLTELNKPKEEESEPPP
ncbi:hypothetical protein ES708_19600 [subsurface metagenome]